MDQISKGVSDRTGLSQSQVAQIAFGAGGHLGVSTPFAGAQAEAKTNKNYQSGISADQQKVLGAMTSDQIAEFKQFGDRVSRDTSIVNAIASDSREASDMSSRLATATSRTSRADATFVERTAFAERLSTAYEHGETISIDMAQDPHNIEMFMRYAQQYGGDSAAAFAMFDAELARQGVRPTRVLSDGSALPASFNDVHKQYNQASTDQHLQPDTAAINRQHHKQVSNTKTPTPSASVSPVISTIRSDIQAQGAAIKGKTSSATADFDGKTEIVEAPDGTLSSKKSLFKQTGKQVAGDAEGTVENAKDAVKNLIRPNK